MGEYIFIVSLIAVAVLGYFAMARLDKFLATINPDQDESEEPTRLNIIVSNIDDLSPAALAFKRLYALFPHTRFSLSVEAENNAIGSLNEHIADVVILSGETEDENPVECDRDVTHGKLPDLPKYELTGISSVCQNQRRVLWADNSGATPYVHEFIQILCELKP